MDPSVGERDRFAAQAGLLPLTAAQRGMWFAENLSPDYSVIIAHYLDIQNDDGELDIDLFVRLSKKQGWELESAFTRIVEVDGQPMQSIDPSAGFRLDILDLRDEPDPVDAARRWMNADYQRTYDLLTDRLATSTLIRVADDRAFWYLRGHHIVVDGFASLTGIRDGLAEYNAVVRGEDYVTKPRVSLADLVADDQAYAQSSRRRTDQEHWAQRAANLPERVTLARHSTIAPLSPVNVIASARVPESQQSRLESLAASLSSSTAVLLTAAFSAYLARMSGSDDVVLSLPVTGRATARTKRAGGMVSNMLPILARDISSITARELIAQMQLELFGALRHQRYRFEDIRIDAGMRDANTASFGPIVNMLFFDSPIEIAGTKVDYHILSSGILEDLRINLYQAGPGEPLVVDLHGNPGLYRQAELDLHLHRFLTFMDRLLDDPDTNIADVDLLLDGEAEQLHEIGQGPATALPAADEQLLDEFDRQVRRSPNAVAVESESRQWTYAELDAHRHALAHRLADDGVIDGDRVVIALPRGYPQLCAIYAALTAGAAYVPVDPEQPAQRRDLIADTVGARVIVDDAYLAGIGFDSADGLTDPRAPLSRGRGGDAGAYVIFTSGSTGKPKGVEVGHRAVLNRLTWMQDDYPLDDTDAVLYKTPTTFDVSVWELFWPLRVGARMVIARPGGHRDPEYLDAVIRDRAVTHLHFVPSMLDTYVDVVSSSRSRVFGPTVRRVFTSGEALSRILADKVAESETVELINLYGPTEAAVDVTEHRVTPSAEPVSIGRPVANTEVRVLDSRLRPVPIGVAGELYLAGVQLAAGYVGRTDLTADRFVAAPGGTPGARMYRTGDLVRWNDRHELDYLGRTDFQIKIRGQRVELGEIEAVLDDIPQVEAAVVVARSDLGATSALVAYLRATDHDLTQASVIATCRRHLPSHMVPSAVVILDTFPVNASGKLDRAALPAPDLHADVPFEAPVSTVERDLAGLIAELVGVERIGLRDNFFAVGGHSLTAARLVSRARAEHGLSIALTDVFESADLEELAEHAVPEDSDAPALRPIADRGPRVPLSHAQTRLWFVNRMDPGAGTYNMPAAVRLSGDIDVDALRAAVLDVVGRHESLRTRYPSIEGEPVQEVLAPEDLPHLAGVTPRRIDGSLLDAIAAEVGRGFDLVDEIGFRWAMLHDGTDHVAVFVMHHIAADGFSLRPLMTDLIGAYVARSSGDAPDFMPLPVQYADYALWQHQLLGDAENPTPRHTSELEFWRAELEGMPDVLALPTDRPRPRVASGRGGYVDIRVDAALAGQVRELAQLARVTPFTVFHSALAAVLGRLAGSDDVGIGTAVAGRDDEITSDLIGMFVNTVVLRTRIPSGATVFEMLTRAHRTRSRALSHAGVPFERVVDALSPQRSSSYTPLFQVGLTMQADQLEGLEGLSDRIEVLDARVPAAKYDLAFAIVEDAETVGYGVEISYATDLFDEETVSGIGDQLIAMVRGMVSAPTSSLAAVDLLPPDRVRALTAPAVSPVMPETLRDLLAAGASRAAPMAPALHGDSFEMTWSVFDARTNQLARELILRGFGPGDTVVVGIPRSVASVFALVAVAKTGATFVSIDPAQPAERRAEMIADAGASVGLTLGAVDRDASSTVDWIVIDDESVELRLAGHSGARILDSELTRAPSLDDLAYLIYTSGSTGRPKAAGVSHRGLANMFANQRSILGLDADASVLHVASPAFDASVFEITMALGVGGRLVVSPADVYGGADLEALIAESGVTHAVMTPSALDTVDPAAVPALTTVVSVGEACPADLMRRWISAGRRFFNLYGPTEATIWATAAGPFTATDPITIGQAVPGVGALVLDGGLRPVADGVAGELYLTGVQLARGYVGRSDLTATRFVADPFGSGTRMYRTGDRVLRTRAGDLIYLGRNDFQIKIRGMRIEPGEIDDALTEHPAVAGALSLGVPGPSGETVLVSYVTLTADGFAEPDDIVEHADRRLPSYMVPHSVVIVDSFRMTTVGKIDRSALPPVDFSVSKEFVAPRTEMEAVVAGVFAEVLGLSRVSVLDGFFELGGNSLSATKAVSALGALFERRIPVKDLFEYPTAARFAAHLKSTMTGRALPPLTARSRAEMVPVSGAQRGMWLLNRADPDSANYNVALALRLTGELDLDALRAAMADIVRRHESLRTTYPMVNGHPIQVIVPAEVIVGELDPRVWDVDGDIATEIARCTGEGFDIVSQAPVRVSILRAGPNDHVLVFVVHHISADGASMAPLARDLMTAYAARHAGMAPAWAPLPVQYADFTLWQAEHLEAVGEEGLTERERQLQYWEARLAGAPATIDLPADRPRPRTPSFDGGAVDFEIAPDVVRSLESIARVNNTTLFMVMHAAFAVLLSRVSGKDDLVIGTPYAGRGDAVLEDVVGMFVNTLAMRTQVAAGEPFDTLLQRVRTEDLLDMAHTDVSFDSVVERVSPASSTSHNPVFQVMFAFQNLEFPTLELDGLRISAVDENLTSAKVDLQLTLFPNDPAGTVADGVMKGQMLFARDLFDQPTVEQFVARFVRILDAVAADPACIVGDIVLQLTDAPSVVADEPLTSLSSLVASAAQTDGALVALEVDGFTMTFDELASMTSAMQAALPGDDPDAALTMALMSMVPSLAAAGPEGLDEVLGQLRNRSASLPGTEHSASTKGVDRA